MKIFHKEYSREEVEQILSLYLDIRQSLLQSDSKSSLDLVIYKELLNQKNNPKNYTVKHIVDSIDLPMGSIVLAIKQFIQLDPIAGINLDQNIQPTILDAWNTHTGKLNNKLMDVPDTSIDSAHNNNQKVIKTVTEHYSVPSDSPGSDSEDIFFYDIPKDLLPLVIKEQLDSLILLIQELKEDTSSNEIKDVNKQIARIKMKLNGIQNAIEILNQAEDDYGNRVYEDQALQFSNQVATLLTQFQDIYGIYAGDEDDSIVALPPPELEAIKKAEEKLSSITRELDEIIRLEEHMEGLEYHSLRNPQFKSDALKFQERLKEFLDDIAELKEKHSLQDLREKAEHLKSVLDKDLENLDPPPVIRDSEPAKPAVQPIERPPKAQANDGQEESNANVVGSYLKILFNDDVHKAESWEDVLSYIMYQIYYLEPSEFDHVMIKHIKYISTLRTRLSKPIKIMNTDYYVEGNLSESEIVSFCCELLKDDARVKRCSVYSFRQNDDAFDTVHLKLTPHDQEKPKTNADDEDKLVRPNNVGQEEQEPIFSPPPQQNEDEPENAGTAAEQPEMDSVDELSSADNKALELSTDLIEKIAADTDLISLQEAERMQILNPDGIPMYYADHDKGDYGKFQLINNKYEYDEWIEHLFQNSRKISRYGIIIGKFLDFEFIGYILNKKDRHRQHRQIKGHNFLVGKSWRSSAYYYLNFEDFHKAKG